MSRGVDVAWLQGANRCRVRARAFRALRKRAQHLGSDSGGPFRYGDFGPLARHHRFVERSCRKLARESFQGMAVYQAKMERKQGFLFRCVDT